MNKNIDLTNLLKDCPQGMPLDCVLFDGEVTFNRIISDAIYPIEIKVGDDCREYLNKYGNYTDHSYGKCVIFPKGKTTWEGFQRPFVDGDVVMCGEDQFAIFKEYIKHPDFDGIIRYYVYYDVEEGDLEIDGGQCCMERLATKEEKEELFQAIKANGYKWNPEEKKLEKLIVPKFKDEDKIHLWTLQDAKEGDVLAINWYEGYDYWEKIIIFKKYHNEGANSPCVEGYGNTFKNRKLAFNDGVPYFSKTWTSCLEPATKEQRDFLFQKIKEAGYKWNDTTNTLEKLIEPKFKIGDTIRAKNGLQTYKITGVTSEYYSSKIQGNDCVEVLPVKDQDDWMLVPNKFDYKTLQPFDKVLVRQYDVSTWCADFYSYYDEFGDYAVCTGGVHYNFCIPYNEDTKHLVGKLEDAPDFYRYWED